MVFNTNKIFGLIRKAALVAPAASFALEDSDPMTKITNILRVYTGYDIQQKNFNFARLMNGWGPYIGAKVATEVIPALTKMVKGII